MLQLRALDLKAVALFLGDAYSVDGPDPFPPPVLDSLRQLVPSDEISYCELDRVRGVVLRLEELPGEVEGPEEPSYWDLKGQHPVCHHHETTGDFRARKISDFMTTAALRRSEIYWNWLHPWGAEYEMSVGLDAPLSHTKVFIFDRAGGRDYNERDRAVLDFLRPHLTNLHEAAQVRRRASQALAVLEEAEAGLVFLDRAGLIEQATPEALRLLSAYFRDFRIGLPDEIATWLRLRAPSPEPLRVECDETTLLVHRIDGALFLEEERNAPPLTEREREILDLVAEGKTNAEIAEAIWIAPGTVRKHLENIYEKLGVHSRTAAVATLNGES